MRIIILVLVLASSCYLSAYSQDTIVLLTGEKILLKQYTFSDTDFYLSYTNKKGKQKTIEREFIYSINDTLGNVKCLYKEDTLAFDNDDEVQLTCDQMFFYVKGQSAAVEHYKAPLVTVGGFLSGAVGAYFPITWAKPIIPTIYSASIGFTNSSKKRVIRKFPSYAENEYFIYGFQEATRAKRTKNAIGGGIVGLFAGIISIWIIGATTQ